MEGVRQMFDGVIFDMDGLMVDTEPVWGECWEPALAHFGYSVPPGIADAVRGSAGDTATRILHEMVSPQLDTKAFWAYFSSLAEKVFSQGVEKNQVLTSFLPVWARGASPAPLPRHPRRRASIATCALLAPSTVSRPLSPRARSLAQSRPPISSLRPPGALVPRPRVRWCSRTPSTECVPVLREAFSP